MADRRDVLFFFLPVKIRRRNFHGWGWVLVAGIVLTAISLLDGSVAPSVAGTATSTSQPAAVACQLRVSAAELRVRSGPSTDSAQVQTLSEGVVVDGTPTVTNGFRELSGNRWAANQFLTPVPGTNCT
jgi:hypothetical protein